MTVMVIVTLLMMLCAERCQHFEKSLNLIIWFLIYTFQTMHYQNNILLKADSEGNTPCAAN